jgi:hypothetical protein
MGGIKSLVKIIRDMKLSLFILLAFSILLLPGCADRGATTNISNGTMNTSANATDNGTTVPPANLTPAWPRYNASGFSFPYLPSLVMSEERAGPNGLISGQHSLPERTAEIMAVRFIDVNATFGKNRDSEMRPNPTKAASDVLVDDRINDTMGFFMKASYVGNITTYAISREAFVAEMPFKVMLNSGTTYSGYALSVYVPERSLLLDIRLLALDSEIAKNMKEQFLLGFRLE